MNAVLLQMLDRILKANNEFLDVNSELKISLQFTALIGHKI